MSSTVFDSLVPDFRSGVIKLVSHCASRNVTMRPAEGRRQPAEQARLWRQSRSTATVQEAIAMLRNEGAPFLANVLDSVGPQGPDQEVTQVLPGNSWHQWGEALDCDWFVDGRLVESDTTLIGGINGYRVYAEEAVRLGLTAGFNWAGFKDSRHVQLRPDDNPRSSGMTWPQIDAAMAAQAMLS